MPEVNVAVFAFLPNFPWELWQMPFYGGVPVGPHWVGIQVCSRATAGDAVIAVVALAVVAAAARPRHWVLRPTPLQVAGFAAVGVAVTIVMEWLATQVLGRWAYAPSMPVVPFLRVGLLPLLPWILVPPLIVWFVRRQLT